MTSTIDLAKKALEDSGYEVEDVLYLFNPQKLERFRTLIEREAMERCISICDSLNLLEADHGMQQADGAIKCMRAIHAAMPKEPG